MLQAVLIAAIAALAPCAAVALAWNQARSKLNRVETQTNGRFHALEEEIARLRSVRRIG